DQDVEDNDAADDEDSADDNSGPGSSDDIDTEDDGADDEDSADDNSGPGNADDADAEDDGGTEDGSDDNSGSESDDGEDNGDDDGDNSGSGNSDDGEDNSGSGNTDNTESSESGENAESGANSEREPRLEDDNQRRQESHKTGASDDDRNDLDFAGDDRELEPDFDDLGYSFVSEEFLVLVDGDQLNLQSSFNISIRARHSLSGLDMTLFNIQANEDQDIAELALEIDQLFGDSAVDANHLYETEATGTYREADCTPRDCAARTGWHLLGNADMRIGLIDTKVDQSHPALKFAEITQRDFVQGRGKRPLSHGTAIASILVGQQSGLYTGLAPDGQLFAASVFSNLDSSGETASVESLVRALDWMVENRVSVINLSMAGPPDTVLEKAILRTIANGIPVIASVGNDGPAAEPMFPAAYPSVIAVTAVDANNRVYRKAVRGAHLDLAAPGVRVLAAEPGGAYGPVTGTSIAAPFVTVIYGAGNTGTKPPSSYQKTAIDLGTPGFDTVYGYGLIHVAQTPGEK
ncbi:MAG: hypothetical protein COA47_03095, partial [Robiginitomaculum sp.]